MTQDARCLLIALKLSLGLALLIESTVYTALFFSAKGDLIIMGAAVGALATFFFGILFCNGALDPNLWARSKPELMKVDDWPNSDQPE